MRTQARVLATLLIVGGIAIAPAPVAAGPGQGNPGGNEALQDFCKALVDEGAVPGFSIGECISLNISADAEKRNFRAHSCDLLRDNGELGLAGWKSYSDCVREER